MSPVTFCLDARTANDHFPGIGRYTFNLARAIGPLLGEHEGLLLLRDPTRPAQWNLEVLASERVQVADVPVSPFALRQQWILPRLLRRLDVSLYHSPYYLMPVATRVPTVVTIHDVVPLHSPRYLGLGQRLAFATAVRLAVRVARALIADSACTARDLQRFLHCPAARMAVVPAAADPIFQPQSPGTVAALQARLNLPQRYVLYLGSNKPHKNLMRLVEAWGRLQPEAPLLVIAGVWDARYPQARQRTAALHLENAIRFLGPVAEADLPVLYAGATLSVLPSEYEGFGLPAIEAMACGVPVACSTAPALLEVVGDAAVPFDPFDVDAIVRAIRGILGDSRRRSELAKRGPARAARFSWRQTAQMTLEVYRTVLTRPPRARRLTAGPCCRP